MGVKSNVGKLFGVLVIGGSALAQANDSGSSALQIKDKNTFCQIELDFNQFDKNGKKSVTTTTCLDEKSDIQVMDAVEVARDKSCMTPFCGCWLG